MTNAVSQESTRAARRKGRLRLAAVVVIGVAIALLILLSTTSPRKIAGLAFVWTMVSAVVFNLASLTARWVLTKNRQPILLVGRFPFVVSLTKLCAFVASVTLIGACIAGLIAGPPLEKIAVRALVIGLIGFGIVCLVANGILNAIVVSRHLRGTLAESSREGVSTRFHI